MIKCQIELKLLPCGYMPPPTSQVALYIQVVKTHIIHVVKTWKEFFLFHFLLK